MIIEFWPANSPGSVMQWFEYVRQSKEGICANPCISRTIRDIRGHILLAYTKTLQLSDRTRNIWCLWAQRWKEEFLWVMLSIDRTDIILSHPDFLFRRQALRWCRQVEKDQNSRRISRINLTKETAHYLRLLRRTWSHTASQECLSHLEFIATLRSLHTHAFYTSGIRKDIVSFSAYQNRQRMRSEQFYVSVLVIIWEK